MGDKARAKAEMRAAGVPLVPGTEGVATLGRGARRGRGARLPGAAEGRGRRWREGHAARRRRRASSGRVRRAAAEAQAAFGDGSLYVEKVLAPARHVEIQVLCDNHGGVLTCGERECSIQRRHQKLIEESPSPALDAELREEMEAAAERACRHIGYRNAGTIEFLVGPDGAFSFIEMNTRLQVEHPVTELVTGIDLVREQVRIAAGEQARPRRPRGPRRGHAIEMRINAEDPSRDFAPGAGTDRALPAAARPGRPRRHVRRGRHDDLAVLRLADREARSSEDGERRLAIERARRALGEFEIEGVRRRATCCSTSSRATSSGAASTRRPTSRRPARGCRRSPAS